MTLVSDILRKLNALGGRLERDSDRLILRAGRQSIPEPLVEELRFAKREILAAGTLTLRTNSDDEHLRRQTTSKAAETLGISEDAHVSIFGEHLRQLGFAAKYPKPAEALEFCEDAHPGGDLPEVSTFGKSLRNPHFFDK